MLSRLKEILENKSKNEVKSAMMSIKGEPGYPQLFPVHYIRKNKYIYILNKDKIDFNILNNYINYAIMDYSLLLPPKIESYDSLIVLEKITKEKIDKEKEEYLIDYTTEITDKRVELGNGYFSLFLDRRDVLEIEINKTNKE